MGYDTEADHVVPISALVAVLGYIKKDTKKGSVKLEANELWEIGVYICLVTSASLWGYTGFYFLHGPDWLEVSFG